MDAVNTRVRSAWKKFHELLPIFGDRCISFEKRGYLYNSCVRSVMLYASETWPMTTEVLSRLRRNDNAMIRWICSKKLSDRIPTATLCARLQLCMLEDVLRCNRLRWYGHVMRMEDDIWPKYIMNFDVNGKNPRGRPKKRWSENIQMDLRHLGLNAVDTGDRLKWRSLIKPNRQRVPSNPCNTRNQGR